MKHQLMIAAGALALAACAASAQAGCVNPGNMKSQAFHAIPGFVVDGLKPQSSSSAAAPADAAHRIVGTWLVTYTTNSNPGGQAFIQWHDDRTEWENINFPIEGGNVCVGSWKPVGGGKVTRLHMGWLYTAGVLSGYFRETETDAVGIDTYTGSNDMKIFDLNGNVQVELTGTSSAVRIAP
jgi:hypothetical protein